MIGIYTRVSTEGQRDQYSLPIQQEGGIKFAENRRREYKIYEDVWSGKVVTRTGWQELLIDIKEKNISILYIHAFDRLSRNTRDALDIIDLMIEKSIEFYVNGTFYDINDPNVQMILTIHYAVATNEGKKISNRSLEGKHKEINSGMKRTDNPYGYSWKYKENGTKYWYINEKEADTIKYIFSLCKLNKGLTEITRHLNDEGHTPKKAKLFEPSAVSRIIRRIEYTGKTFNTENEIIESKIYKPIISFEDWNEVQEYYSPKESFARNRSIFGVSHLASAILRCGYCDAPYNYHQGYRKWINNDGSETEQIRRFYFHKFTKQHKDKKCVQAPKQVHYYFIDELFKCIYSYSVMNPKIVLSFYEKQNKNKDIDKIKQDIIRITNKIKDTEKEKDNYVKAIALSDNLESLLPEIQNREKLIKELISSRKEKELSISEILNNEKNMHIKFSADKFKAFIDSEDLMYRRKELKAIIKSAIIKENIITVTLITGFEFIFDLEEMPRKLRYLKESIENDVNGDLFLYMIEYNRKNNKNWKKG